MWRQLASHFKMSRQCKTIDIRIKLCVCVFLSIIFEKESLLKKTNIIYRRKIPAVSSKIISKNICALRAETSLWMRALHFSWYHRFNEINTENDMHGMYENSISFASNRSHCRSIESAKLNAHRFINDTRSRVLHIYSLTCVYRHNISHQVKYFHHRHETYRNLNE